MISRKRIPLAALAALAIAAPVAGQSPAAEPVNLRFGTYAFQPTTVAATEQIVADWNAANPAIQVELVTIDVNSVHDSLVTQFQGGTTPDIIHDEAADLAGFVEQGFLADMTALVPETLKADVPEGIWDSVTYDGKVFASPTLLQSYVVFANKKLLDAAGIAVPTIDAPWTWDDFATNAKALTKDGQYGLCWGLKSAGALVMSTSLGYGGTFFATDGDTTTFQFGPAEQQVPTRIHDMAYTDGSIDPSTIGASGSDNLAVFLADRCAMFVGGNFYAQQLTDSAPDGFEWVMLPLLKGDAQTQNANPQTLSIAAQSEHPAEAMQFIDFFSNAKNLASVAQGDWLAPATTSAGAAVLAATGGASGWDVIVSSSKLLAQAPFQKLEGYPQWKDQTLNPSLQQYFANQIDLATLTTQLTDGWNTVAAGQ